MGEEGVAKAQCALSTLRNLLRNEEASVEVLVEHQAGGAWKGQYHFPEWSKVMQARLPSWCGMGSPRRRLRSVRISWAGLRSCGRCD